MMFEIETMDKFYTCKLAINRAEEIRDSIDVQNVNQMWFRFRAEIPDKGEQLHYWSHYNGKLWNKGGFNIEKYDDIKEDE